MGIKNVKKGEGRGERFSPVQAVPRSCVVEYLSPFPSPFVAEEGDR
jgi:hypothetical protein